jgi:hypothetical protein
VVPGFSRVIGIVQGSSRETEKQQWMRRVPPITMLIRMGLTCLALPGRSFRPATEVKEGARLKKGAWYGGYDVSLSGLPGRSSTLGSRAESRSGFTQRLRRDKLRVGQRPDTKIGEPCWTRPRRETAARGRCRKGRAGGGRLTTTRRIRRDAARPACGIISN